MTLRTCTNSLTISCVRHVQIDNEDAIAFYKQFDFKIAETVEGYYKVCPVTCLQALSADGLVCSVWSRPQRIFWRRFSERRLENRWKVAVAVAMVVAPSSIGNR